MMPEINKIYDMTSILMLNLATFIGEPEKAPNKFCR